MKNLFRISIVSLLTLASLHSNASISDLFNDTKSKYEKEQKELQAANSEKIAKMIFDEVVEKVVKDYQGVDLKNAKIERETNIEEHKRNGVTRVIEKRYIQTPTTVCKVRSVIIENTDGGMGSLMDKVTVHSTCIKIDRSDMSEANEEFILSDVLN